MRALGFDVKKPDVLKILKDYDREATGKISFEDFQEVSKYLMTSNCLISFSGHEYMSSSGTINRAVSTIKE